MPIPNPSSRNDFKIAIICALKLEAKAVLPLFDATYDENLDEYRKLDEDENAYVLGSIGKYHVALVILPGEGKANASFASITAKRSYPGLELALVVGVCGGVPYATDPTSHRRDIFLGDVIISNGVVQHDLGRRYDDEFVRKDTVHANLGKPSRRILTFLTKLDLFNEKLTERLASYLTTAQGNSLSVYPGAEKDQLFSPDYPHISSNCKCAESPCPDNTVVARRRELGQHDHTTSVHFGLVASGDTVMKSAKYRDQISALENVIAFEMESAGVWDNLPCIVVKGVSDYADSHKNKDWQFFAAASAAACARAILDEIPASLSKPPAEASTYHNQGQTSSSRKRTAGEISEVGLGEVEMDDDFYLDSLTFPQAQFRVEEISTAHKKTCEWIVGQPQYLNWMNEDALPSHGGFFWIKGKPGAGKSTMMKYLLQRAKHTLHETLILSFFFHAQGILLERTVMGMYRSLLHQLVCSKVIPPDARKLFLELAKSLKPQDGIIVWTKRDLKNLLSLTIKSLQEHRVLILIDAVDECNQDEVKDMTSFFQELGRSAISHQVNLRICLASRHYPHISLQRGIELMIEDQQEHQADLEKYITSELKGAESETIQTIRDTICTRASGVFLWAVLVVRSLNDAFDRGKISGLLERLDEIPDGLDNLFTDILTRDQNDKNALLFSLQLILFSRRILTREEVYFAVLFEATESIESNIDWGFHSPTAMDRRILDVTKGLAETSNAGKMRDRSYRVRFIHESVRDFLLQRNGFSRIHRGEMNTVGFIAVSQNRLKEVCFRYISLFCQDPLGEVILHNAEGKHISNKYEAHKDIRMSFPFLDYAIRNVLEHSNLAQAGGISQEEFVNEFSRKLHFLKSAFNAVQQFATRRYKDDVSLLYILANGGLHELIPWQLLRGSKAWDLCGQHVCAMGTAIHQGDMASVRALLGMQVQNDSCSSEAESISHIEPELVTRMKHFFAELAQQTRSSRSRVKSTQLLSNYAFEGGHIKLLRLFLYTNAVVFTDHSMKGKSTPLYWSIVNSKPDLLEFLISEAKVDVEAAMRKADSEKRPLLRAAFSDKAGDLDASPDWHVADRRLLEIMLQQSSLDTNSQDKEGRNAVHWAVLAGDTHSVIRLISGGFDCEHCDLAGRDPLSHATEKGHIEIVQALLKVEGLNANRRDLSGATAISRALHSAKNAPAMLEAMFLSKKVDFNVRDEMRRTPLALISSKNDPSGIIDILVRVPMIDANSRDLHGRTPLILGVIARQHQQVKAILRRSDLNINAQDKDGRTALSWAVGPINFPPNQKGSVTAFAWSWSNTPDAIVGSLLESKTLNRWLPDNWGHTPAWWAQAHATVLLELGKRVGDWHWKDPSLTSSVGGCDSRGPIFAPTESFTVKAGMKRFLEGDDIMKTPSRWDLNYRNVSLGWNWTLQGIVIEFPLCSMHTPEAKLY